MEPAARGEDTSRVAKARQETGTVFRASWLSFRAGEANKPHRLKLLGRWEPRAQEALNAVGISGVSLASVLLELSLS